MDLPFPAAAAATAPDAPLICAVPKGRILKELGPLLTRAGATPAADLLDEDSRRLREEVARLRVELAGAQELAGKAQKDLEFYQQLFRQMLDPGVLYLALIMHDTGRAAEKKTHADESTILADKVCRRLQIKGERRNQLLLLVDNHLIMFMTATKQDPDDPEVVQNFARIVKNRANLDALLVMTMADSKGVGGNSWTGHKELLLRELYRNTVRYFDAPEDFMARATVPLDSLKATVLAEFHRAEKEHGYEREVETHFEKMPRAYFNFRKPSTIANHLRQFRAFFEQLEKGDDDLALMPVLRWEDKPLEGCSKLMVVGWDRHLLLARVAGALAAENLSIVSADFYQRSDHLVLDVFLGSGSTLMAAESTGRICRGIEMDPLYVDLTIRRWQRQTGKAAVRQDGASFDAVSTEAVNINPELEVAA
jgi:[protein-PII] uridylyltransferase